jgi:hypothetical protein
VEGKSVEEILEEVRLLLQEEDIPFREIMDMLFSALGIPRGRTYSRGKPSMPALCPCW